MTSGPSSPPPPPAPVPRCYVRHSEMPEESGRVELKAHRCLSALDLSPLSYSPGRNGGLYEKWHYQRKVLSGPLCGMLNTGRGGTIYLGVTDKGTLEGLHMTTYQKVKKHNLHGLYFLPQCIVLYVHFPSPRTIFCWP